LQAAAYNEGMNDGIEIGLSTEATPARSLRTVPTDRAERATGNVTDAREEVSTMAKKDDGRREIKKGKERDY
jgi:hypothetical protein